MSHSTGASCAELAQTGTIVGPQFCASQPIHLAFTTKAPWLKDDYVTVTDMQGRFIFWSMHARRWNRASKQILYESNDTYDHPLISMRGQLLTAHRRWKAFIGAGSEDRSLLFSIKKGSMFQIRPEFDVFMASNTEEEVCDFKIKGSYRKRTCTICKGDSQMVLAQMSKQHEAPNLPQAEDIFGVHINPNTDYCFIAALFMILHDMYDCDGIMDDAIKVAEVANVVTELGSIGN